MGVLAIDEVIALAHLLTHAGGCIFSESLHQPPDLVGKALEEKKTELGTEFIRTQQRLALSLQRGSSQCTARGSLLMAQHWVLLEGDNAFCLLMGSFLISGPRGSTSSRASVIPQ